ncbi:unnamed protein product [Effrenium voratum]|nr:unnamed protein product [Effrenium voratum]
MFGIGLEWSKGELNTLRACPKMSQSHGHSGAREGLQAFFRATIFDFYRCRQHLSTLGHPEYQLNCTARSDTGFSLSAGTPVPVSGGIAAFAFPGKQLPERGSRRSDSGAKLR